MIEMTSMRRVFSALLIILLPAMTSWASACDLSCSLPQFHSSCHVQDPEDRTEGAVSPKHAMDPKMEMGDESPAAAEPQNGFIYLHDSCTHNSCNEPSISAIAKRAPENRAHVLQFAPLEPPIARSIHSERPRFVTKEDPPNLRPYDPLSVNLRI